MEGGGKKNIHLEKKGFFATTGNAPASPSSSSDFEFLDMSSQVVVDAPRTPEEDGSVPPVEKKRKAEEINGGESNNNNNNNAEQQQPKQDSPLLPSSQRQLTMDFTFEDSRDKIDAIIVEGFLDKARSKEKTVVMACYLLRRAESLISNVFGECVAQKVIHALVESEQNMRKIAVMEDEKKE